MKPLVTALALVLAASSTALADPVIERVEEHRAVTVEQRGQDAQVHLEAGGEGEGGFASHELGQALLEPHVQVEGAVQQARSGAAPVWRA